MNKKEVLIDVGRRLRKIRLTYDLSLEEMAKKTHLTASGYNKNENGVNFPGPHTLYALHYNFEISMDWLMFGKGPMHHRDRQQLAAELVEKIELLKKEMPAAVELLKKMS